MPTILDHHGISPSHQRCRFDDRGSSQRVFHGVVWFDDRQRRALVGPGSAKKYPQEPVCPPRRQPRPENPKYAVFFVGLSGFGLSIEDH